MVFGSPQEQPQWDPGRVTWGSPTPPPRRRWGRIVAVVALLVVVAVAGAGAAYLLLGSDATPGDDPTDPSAVATPTTGTAIDFTSARGVVAEVRDGSTLVVEIDGTPTTVRVVGVDSPDPADADTAAECFAAEAQRFTADLTVGRPVSLLLDEARLGEDPVPAGVVLADGRDLAVVLARNGMARFQPRDPPYDKVGAIRSGAREAEEAGKGLWGAGCATSSPGASSGSPPRTSGSPPPAGSAPPGTGTVTVPTTTSAPPT